jgi:hypothetical protein
VGVSPKLEQDGGARLALADSEPPATDIQIIPRLLNLTIPVEALIGFANSHMWEVNMSYASDDRAAQISAAETAAKQRRGCPRIAPRRM